MQNLPAPDEVSEHSFMARSSYEVISSLKFRSFADSLAFIRGERPEKSINLKSHRERDKPICKYGETIS